jgi:hypothetical protein
MQYGAGNPLSQIQLADRFGLTRTKCVIVVCTVAPGGNGTVRCTRRSDDGHVVIQIPLASRRALLNSQPHGCGHCLQGRNLQAA